MDIAFESQGVQGERGDLEIKLGSQQERFG